MTRHVIDQPRRRDGETRLRHYLSIERAAGPGPRERALQRTTVEGRADGRRLREYLRIEREIEV